MFLFHFMALFISPPNEKEYNKLGTHSTKLQNLYHFKKFKNHTNIYIKHDGVSRTSIILLLLWPLSISLSINLSPFSTHSLYLFFPPLISLSLSFYLFLCLSFISLPAYLSLSLINLPFSSFF